MRAVIDCVENRTFRHTKPRRLPRQPRTCLGRVLPLGGAKVRWLAVGEGDIPLDLPPAGVAHSANGRSSGKPIHATGIFG